MPIVMPEGRKFPYTPQGIRQATDYAKQTGQKVVAEGTEDKGGGAFQGPRAFDPERNAQMAKIAGQIAKGR